MVIAAEWTVWLTLLLVPVVAVVVAVVGLGVLVPLATLRHARTNVWPKWTTRAIGYGASGLFIAVPAGWLLARVLSE